MPNFVNALKIAASVEDDVQMTRRQWVAVTLTDPAVTQTQNLVHQNIEFIQHNIDTHLMELRLRYDRKSFAAEMAPLLGFWAPVYFRCWDYAVDVDTAVVEFIDKYLITDKAFAQIEGFLFAS
jgi:hypothetical protein